MFYVLHHIRYIWGFMAHIVGHSENMKLIIEEEKLYKSKYTIWWSCWYLYGQKHVILITCNVNQRVICNCITYYLHKMHINITCCLSKMILIRAGYRSKFFDIDTLSSLPVPEQYFFRYQFYEISFNKIYIISKNFGLIFFSLLTFIQTQRLISWATAQRNKIYPTQ